jgi:hypothetical protein
MPLRNTKGNKLLELKGDYWMSKSSTILGSTTGMVICGWEKCTWLGWWESSFVLRGQSTSHLAYPKVFFPSRSRRRFVKDDSDV